MSADKITEYRRFLQRKAPIDVPTGIAEVPDLNARAFDFQKAIISWGLKRGRVGVFADCGLGKTLIESEWARVVSEQHGRVLILAPLAVANQTVREGEKFGIEIVYARSMDEAGKAPIVITNYEMLDRFDPSAFVGIVLDESSILKNYTGKFRNQIIEAFMHTPFRLAGTATPAPNDHQELGNHSEFLGVMSRTEMLASFFVHDGGSTQDWRLKGHAESDFWRWMASWAVVMRTPSDLGFSDKGFDLPPIHIDRHVLRSAHNAPPDGMLFRPEALGLAELRSEARHTLVDRVGCIADIVNASSDCWVVWCETNAEADAAIEAIPGAVEVRGNHTPDQKRDRLLSFADGNDRVMITKPSIAGFGMNWQHCSHMAFVGLSHSYEKFYQAVRRCWRFGQDRPVHVHVAIGETEVSILKTIERKEADAKRMAVHMVAAARDEMISHLHGVRRMTSDYATETNSDENWEARMGDSVELIREVPSDSLHFSVFSPPFASLYTYTASDRDMGNCATGDEFAEHFGHLVPELLRVTMPGRLCAIHCMDLPTLKSRDGFIGLYDFPGDLTRAMALAGWVYHSKVTIWKDPVTQMQRTKALGLLHKQIKKDATMSRQGLADYLIIFRKPGDNPEPVENTGESFPVEQWQRWASPSWGEADGQAWGKADSTFIDACTDAAQRHDLWLDIDPGKTLNRKGAREEKDERHICPLQLDVIERAIALWTNPGDLVFSPFMGIGSEGWQALKMGRRFLGFELKASYYRMAVHNLEEASKPSPQLDMFQAAASE